MANQMIALQARAPQTDFLGGAVQRNAQMMNMMSQQRAAERQAAQAQQTMDIARAKEERDAALAKPQMEKATADAQAAQMKRASDFLDLSIAGMKMARGPEDAIKIGGWLKSQFNDPVLRDAVDQTLSSLLEPGADFEKRREEMLFQSMGAKEQLDQKFIELTSGAETWTVATPTYAGAKRAPAEVQGTRQKAPVGITYIKTDKGIVPMPKEMTGGDGGLVGGERGGDGYDVVYGFGDYAKPDKPLTSMTLGEVQDFQRNKLIPATRGKVGAGPDMGTGAVGKYQIVYSTLQEYAPKVLGANWKSQPFTPEVQERIAEAIYNDKRGGNLKKTWQGLPNNKPGEYANVPWSQVRDKIAQVESGGGRRGGNGGGVRMGQVLPGTAPETTAKPSTEGERRFGTIAQQMRSNLKDAVSILQKNPDAIRPSTAEYVASQIPVYGEEARLFAESEPRQQLVASLLRFLDNVTYVNTGAGTSKTQEENYRRSYIPTYQDSDASAYRKLKSMVQFAQNVKAAAGVMWTPDMDADLATLRQAVEQLAPKPKGQRATGVDRNNPLLKGM